MDVVELEVGGAAGRVSGGVSVSGADEVGDRFGWVVARGQVGGHAGGGVVEQSLPAGSVVVGDPSGHGVGGRAQR